MSDTPRTDELTFPQPVMMPSYNTVPSAFASQLERELAEVTKQRDALVSAIRKHKSALAFTLGDCDVELYEALEEVQP